MLKAANVMTSSLFHIYVNQKCYTSRFENIWWSRKLLGILHGASDAIKTLLGNTKPSTFDQLVPSRQLKRELSYSVFASDSEQARFWELLSTVMNGIPNNPQERKPLILRQWLLNEKILNFYRRSDIGDEPSRSLTVHFSRQMEK